jgi:hypothetical protein
MIFETQLLQHEYDELAEVFNGGLVMASVEDVVDEALKVVVFVLKRNSDMRRDASISGAMRWPWSQEYPIRNRILFEVGRP